MAGFIKTIIEGILDGLDQMAQDPNGPPQKRRVPKRAPAKRVPVSPASNKPTPTTPWQSPNSTIASTTGEQEKLPATDLTQFAPQQTTSNSRAAANIKSTGPVRQPGGPAITAVKLLRSPGGAREAMIASEILNRPEHRWK